MKLTDLRPDLKNRRKHTARNLDMLQESIEACGTGRSILIDEHNEVIAGNATLKAASNAGLSKVTVIEARGDEVIAVRRTGLSAKQKRDLALYDNRTAELAEWDVEQLAEDTRDGYDVATFFSEEELSVLALPEEEAPTEFGELDESLSTEHTCPKCGYEWSGGM
jgi:ParB-like chromosome segregation protein Spo0J